MIGTTRSRVSFFMNRFRKLGYIKYNGGIRVHKSLLKVFLQDQLPEENSSRPKLLDPHPVEHDRQASQARVAAIALTTGLAGLDSGRITGHPEVTPKRV